MYRSREEELFCLGVRCFPAITYSWHGINNPLLHSVLLLGLRDYFYVLFLMFRHKLLQTQEIRKGFRKSPALLFILWQTKLNMLFFLFVLFFYTDTVKFDALHQQWNTYINTVKLTMQSIPVLLELTMLCVWSLWSPATLVLSKIIQFIVF